jgi:hypothetical protein
MNFRLPFAVLGGFALIAAVPAAAQSVTATPSIGPFSSLSGAVPSPSLGATAPIMGSMAPTIGIPAAPTMSMSSASSMSPDQAPYTGMTAADPTAGGGTSSPY